MAPKRVCVVGAGPSGLVSTKTLVEAGLDVVCFESSPSIGGHWVYDNPNGRSSAYMSLETNTTKRMSRFSDFTMPDEWPEFPDHKHILRWFCDYADHFGLHRYIESETDVVRALPHSDHGWTVNLRRKNGNERDENFDAVIAASGNYWDPKQVSYDGTFAGDIVHAQAYRAPDTPIATDGKRIVIVGIGTTGCELASELAQSNAAAVTLSARSGNWILPKLINGEPAAKSAPLSHPSDPVPPLMRIMPSRLRQWFLETVTERAFKKRFGPRMKRFEELGLPPPPSSPLEKRPTLAQDLMDNLVSGAIKARPGIQRLDGKTVIFTDGSTTEADLILNAVGYHLTYPYLPQDLADTRNDDLELFLGTAHTERDDLFIVGASRPMGAFWPIAEAQAQYAAAILSGKSKLPPASERRRRAEPILNRRSFNPALYGLAIREEIARGKRRI